MNNWYLYCKKADFAAISSKFNISPMLARILVNRGIDTDEAISSFLNDTMDCLNDPFLFNDMEKAVQITLSAISQKKKIRVIGDYDMDGICSAYILESVLSYMNAIVDVRLPHRVIDGYGMNEVMAQEAGDDGISLIITCDNGVSSFEAISLAKKLGITVIITDHHELPEVLPPADAIIDAKKEGEGYPYRDLCGAAVAYKFCQALLTGRTAAESSELLERMLQYCGMATIADIVPLQGENRILAREGIKHLRKTKEKGILALLKIKGIEPGAVKEHHIGFVLGPCVNSAGRLDDPQKALRLFEAETDEEAQTIAKELYDLNETRKEMTAVQSDIAEKMIQEEAEKTGEIPKVLVIYLPEAHESVAGIIAGKLKEKYSHPTFVITNSEEGPKGSGRSVDGYDMIEALRRHEELFIKYGGHAKASGFTLRCRPDEMRKVLNEDPDIKELTFEKKIWIDMQLPFKYAGFGFVEELKKLQPFGCANPRPMFAQKNVRLTNMKLLGHSRSVLKMTMTDSDSVSIEGVLFNHGQSMDEFYDKMVRYIAAKGDEAMFSVLYYPDINEFHQSIYIQAIVEEIKFKDESFI